MASLSKVNSLVASARTHASAHPVCFTHVWVRLQTAGALAREIPAGQDRDLARAAVASAVAELITSY